ncbi:MAG: fatty acid hydroxylase family protein [Myxococcales bacterium]|nr:fatty acid hydroxylase family protein [Myxococcales bacterium]
MDERLIAFAVPVFFAAMIVEFFLNRRHLAKTGVQSPTGGIGGYRYADTLSNLCMGIGQQALDPVFRVLMLVAYGWTAEHLAFAHLDATAASTWIIAILGVDLCFYWFHRWSHRVNVLWAVHHVHHSSEEYNLAVALRQPWLEKLVDIPFYLPMALIGVPLEVYAAAFTLNLLYQFFVHTRWVPKLGPLEGLLSTPSNHRVHHAVNPAYIDKNYGGILIIYDRLFGTYAAEAETPVYGTVKPLCSWNPVYANSAVWLYMAQLATATTSWTDKLWVWWAPPEWRPLSLGGKVTIPPPRQGVAYDLTVPTGRRWLVRLSFLLVTTLLIAFLWTQRSADLLQQCVFATLCLMALGAVGAALEGRPWIAPLALVSFGGLAVGWPLWLGWPPVVVAMLAATTLAVVVLAWRQQSEAVEVVP